MGAAAKRKSQKYLIDAASKAGRVILYLIDDSGIIRRFTRAPKFIGELGAELIVGAHLARIPTRTGKR